MTDVLLNCGGILCAVTLYSGSPIVLNILLLLPAFSILLVSKKPRDSSGKKSGISLNSIGKEDDRNKMSSTNIPMKPFITNYRGAMMMITCLAILAVDFRVFPRRFAKVENWGTSVMDMGVGSFVFSAGLVSAKALIKDQFLGQKMSLSKRLLNSCRHSVPLFVLGLIRFYSVKGLDYAEHVTEYGVHWNFFFTLAFLGPLVAVVQSIFRLLPSYTLIAVVITVVHESILDFTSLTEYVIAAPREDFISMNREGIVSFAGYLAIFLVGIATGMYSLPRDPRNVSAKLRSYWLRETACGKLCTWAIIWIGLYYLSTSVHGFGLTVSRRLANMPYVFWVSAFNCSQLALYCGMENLCFGNIYDEKNSKTEHERCKSATSQLLYSLNRNSLAIFLVANLMTGLVNQIIPTLEMNTIQSMAILSVYACTFCSLALLLDKVDISLKL